jgi:hypothetical protein
MFPPVLQDVDDCMTYLARRGESPGMIPVRPHRPTAAERAIDGLSDANGEALNTTPESAGFVCF